MEQWAAGEGRGVARPMPGWENPENLFSTIENLPPFPAMSTSAYFWEAPEVERKERDIGNSSCPSKVVDEALQWER